MNSVQLYQLAYTAPDHDSGIVGAPRRAKKPRGLGGARRASHKGAEIQLSGPNSSAIRSAHENVPVYIGNEDFRSVVAPPEIADLRTSVVDQFHDGAAIVVSPDDDGARRVAGGDLVQMWIPLHYRDLGK